MGSVGFIGNKTQPEESFRDKVSTVSRDGERVWLYPKNPKGKFTNIRTILALLFIALMLGGPFLKINGEPMLLLNILERKFIIFGKIFWPQDFHIFLLITMAFMIFIVLFTVIYGRVFCGFVCPQTIFMESVFRKIEFWIEGDWHKRIALDKAPASFQKTIKKSLKHLVYLTVSFLISNTFLSYIIGIEKVLNIWREHPESQWGTIISILLFTGIFYWIYARFREQVCTTVCPYGRLQGVLLDKNSLVVAYDYVRGEPRTKFKKQLTAALPKGDCIDCHQCVDVCPMGIDIRNGTQMECTNCTACIDACNFVMDSVGRDRGLIRFDSEEGIAKGNKFKITSRVIGYSIILLVLLGFITTLLMYRNDVQTTMLRTPGVLYQKVGDHQFSNLYNLKIINKTSKEMKITVKMLSEKGELKLVGHSLTLPAQGTTETAAFIIVKDKDITSTKMPFELGVYAEGKLVETVTTSFIGPVY